MSKGIELMAAERQRQIEEKGWALEHDDQHTDESLVVAAACYALHIGGENHPRFEWPWDISSWKPSKDPIRNLEKAGALIAAEIDRLIRRQNA